MIYSVSYGEGNHHHVPAWERYLRVGVRRIHLAATRNLASISTSPDLWLWGSRALAARFSDADLAAALLQLEDVEPPVDHWRYLAVDARRAYVEVREAAHKLQRTRMVNGPR